MLKSMKQKFLKSDSQIRLAKNILNILKDFITNIRGKLSGAKKCDYVFLTEHLFKWSLQICRIFQKTLKRNECFYYYGKKVILLIALQMLEKIPIQIP